MQITERFIAESQSAAHRLATILLAHYQRTASDKAIADVQDREVILTCWVSSYEEA